MCDICMRYDDDFQSNVNKIQTNAIKIKKKDESDFDVSFSSCINGNESEIKLFK